MSVEEASGWSVRDNHCSTLKQYIISAFTPKGRGSDKFMGMAPVVSDLQL